MMLNLLGKLPPEGALQFFHKVIDGICGRAYPRYQDYNTIWNLAEWIEILEQMTAYFKSTVGKDVSDEEAVQQLGDLSSDCRKALVTCLKGRRHDIRHALIEKTNAICSAQLLDFDWQLKIYVNENELLKQLEITLDLHTQKSVPQSSLALSSDKLSMLQMPLLNLDLDLRENDDVKLCSVEMNKEELQNLINALEAANKVVLQLK